MYFLTGNKNKYLEAKSFFPDLKQRETEIDLPEIQSLDHREVTTAKLKAARPFVSEPFFVEDTSLHFETLNGFPGPFIKHLVRSIGVQGIRDLMKHQENKNIIARCTIGYRDGQTEHIIVGECQGQLVAPRGETNFGRDPIFQPTGYNNTFAEMTKEEKNMMSHRAEAMRKLKKIITGS